MQMPIHDLNGKMVEVKRAVAKERSSGHIRSPAGRGGNFGGHIRYLLVEEGILVAVMGIFSIPIEIL